MPNKRNSQKWKRRDGENVIMNRKRRARPFAVENFFSKKFSHAENVGRHFRLFSQCSVLALDYCLLSAREIRNYNVISL